MGIVVLRYHHGEMDQMPVIEALPNKATEGLIALGKAFPTSHGYDDCGAYRVYGMFLPGVYLRFIVRRG